MGRPATTDRRRRVHRPEAAAEDPPPEVAGYSLVAGLMVVFLLAGAIIGGAAWAVAELR